MCLRLAVWALEATSASSSAGFLISTVLPGMGGGAAGAASAKEAALAKHPFLASEQDRLVGVSSVGGFSTEQGRVRKRRLGQRCLVCRQEHGV